MATECIPGAGSPVHACMRICVHTRRGSAIAVTPAGCRPAPALRVQVFNEGMEHAAQNGRLKLEIECLCGLGMTERNRANFKEAVQYLERAATKASMHACMRP